jgi:hypothetical protein
MTSITLNLNNTQNLLRPLSRSVIKRAVYAAAESYRADVKAWINAGHGFRPRHGALEQSILWRGVSDTAAQVTAGQEPVNLNYAGFVEFGTGIHAGHSPWVIRPTGGRRGLRFPGAGGGFIIRRSVVHKGSKAKPYFFADMPGRKQRMGEAALSVIMAGILSNG